MAQWPGGARGALCLSFDNLGVDQESSAAAALPGLLKALAERDLAATFFAEGVNAELAPDTLREITAAGHEVAYHAWLHESWGDLSATEQADNLARGVDAFGDLGIAVRGLRPPGGQLGEGGAGLLRKSGLTYASPAGKGAGIEDDIALLPFQWRHVDATCMLPGLDPVRKQMTGRPDPIDPATFTTYLQSEIKRTEANGNFMAIVLHLPLLAWLGEDNLPTILDQLSSTQSWVARNDQVAAHIQANKDAFCDGTTLDQTSWA